MEPAERVYSEIVLHKRCVLGPDAFQPWITVDRIEFRNNLYAIEQELSKSLNLWQKHYEKLKFYQILQKKKIKRIMSRRTTVSQEFSRIAWQVGVCVYFAETCLVHPHVLEALNIWMESFRKAKIIPLDSQGIYR